MSVQVKGIDRDGEPREERVEALPVRDLAQTLCEAGYKYAAVFDDAGEMVAGVQREAGDNHRSWWVR